MSRDSRFLNYSLTFHQRIERRNFNVFFFQTLTRKMPINVKLYDKLLAKGGYVSSDFTHFSGPTEKSDAPHMAGVPPPPSLA